MNPTTQAEAAATQARAAGVTRRLRLPAALLVAAALKAGLLLAGAVPFNSDEAVVALMARHILAGARPVFFYGQAYMGSLDAYLVAGAFAVLGESVVAVRVVQLLLYLGTLATTYWLGRRIFRSEWVAGAAAVFLAIPPVLTTVYTSVSLGNYGEVLLLGNLALLLTLGLGASPGAPTPRRAAGWLLLGVLGGLGFWSLPLAGVYLLPCAVYLAVVYWRQPRALVMLGLVGAAGFALGAWPWLAYTAEHGLVTVLEGAGTFLPRPANEIPVLGLFRHLFYFLLFGLTVVWGLRPPWSAEFLALPLLPYALALHLGALIFAIRRVAQQRDQASAGRALLAGVMATLVAAYLLTPFGEDPSGRYFVPLTIVTALFMAEMLHWLRLRRKRRTPWRKWFAQTLALGLLAFYWWGNVAAAARQPPGVTTQFDAVAQVDTRALPALMDFLREQGETRGYTNYWVSYPLAFLSDETLIYVPALPYHLDFRNTERFDRYPPYAQLVAESPRAAFITTNHPPLDDHLREVLAALGVEYQEARFGQYQVFYGLSRHVRPAELSLSPECCAP